jgi:GT2 family glycosyltransferase
MKTLPSLGEEFSITALICTRNRLDVVVKCVRTLVAQTRLPDELVVIDSSDEIGLETRLREVIAGVDIAFIYRHTDPGLTLQRNIGVSMAHGSIVLLPDDDTVLEPDYVENIAKVYAEDREGAIGGVQGSFLGEKGLSRWGIAFRRVFQLPGATGLGRIQASGFPSYINLPDKLTDVDMLSGANASYRREVLEQFKWNEAFRGYSYMEDDDYSYRISREYCLKQTPKAKLVHEHSPSARDNMERAVRMEVRNHGLFFKFNMPKSLGNRLAFAWAEIGCCLLTLRAYGFRGLVMRFKAYLGKNEP